MTKKQINQPFVGVVSTWNLISSCNITLRRQAQAVKKGVLDAEELPEIYYNYCY